MEGNLVKIGQVVQRNVFLEKRNHIMCQITNSVCYMLFVEWIPSLIVAFILFVEKMRISFIIRFVLIKFLSLVERHLKRAVNSNEIAAFLTFIFNVLEIRTHSQKNSIKYTKPWSAIS